MAYVGAFEKDKPNGHGKLMLPDGTKYVDNFRDGKMDGTGKMTHPDGEDRGRLVEAGQVHRGGAADARG
jgi:hypothetical protein